MTKSSPGAIASGLLYSASLTYSLLKDPGYGVPYPGGREPDFGLAPYFSCIVLISATLPARWHSVHCSAFAIAVLRAS